MLKLYFLWFLSLGLVANLSLYSLAQATDLTDADAIVEKANLAAFYPANDGRGTVRMMIVDPQGRKQFRQFIILRKDIEDAGKQNFLVLFQRPADVSKTVFMVKKHIKRDDDRWLYLPGLDLVKRIAAGDKRTSFVGSHFFYEDVSGRSLHADHHELIETNERYYVIKNTPKAPKEVEFDHYFVWVDKQSWLPVKTEYWDQQGKLYRRIQALDIQPIKGIATATKMKAEDLKSGGYTLNEIRFVDYDLGVPENIFSERSLRNPPRRWLQSN